MRVAVVGAGISGLSAAFELCNAGAEVVLYEKEHYLGGHARTVAVDGVDLDVGFMVFNRVTYPNMMEFFEKLGVDMEVSDMSFSVSLEGGRGCEWGSRNGLASLFAQKGNLFNPYFWLMIREIIKFKDDTLRYLTELEENPDLDRNETLELFIKSHGYSELFQKAYLVPICASIWSCPSEGVMNFSAYSVLSFCRNHHLLQHLPTGLALNYPTVLADLKNTYLPDRRPPNKPNLQTRSTDQSRTNRVQWSYFSSKYLYAEKKDLLSLFAASQAHQQKISQLYMMSIIRRRFFFFGNTIVMLPTHHLCPRVRTARLSSSSLIVDRSHRSIQRKRRPPWVLYKRDG